VKSTFWRWFGPVSLILAAFAGYFLCGLFVPHPDIRSGFLLLSPLFAFFLLRNLMSARFRYDALTKPKPDRASIDLIQTVADKVGVEAPPVTIERKDSSSKTPLFLMFEVLMVWESQWKALPWPSREFVVAQQFVLQKRFRSWDFVGPWLAFAVVASTFSCLNLWLIVAVQVGTPLASSLWKSSSQLQRSFGLDEETVRLTGDVEGAIAYLKTLESEDGRYAHERIANLKKVLA